MQNRVYAYLHARAWWEFALVVRDALTVYLGSGRIMGDEAMACGGSGLTSANGKS
jgi:hypothetical protein